MQIGYARVSTTDQNLDVQLEALQDEGCTKIFTEKASGADGKRVELVNALEFIRESDTLIVTKLDRLARSMVDFWKIVQDIESKGANLKVLNMGLDTSTSQGRLVMGYSHQLQSLNALLFGKDNLMVLQKLNVMGAN